MTTIELEAWKKIVDNPREEVRALFKRRELTFAGIHDDPLSWHMQAALWGILRCLDDAFSRYEYDRDEPSDRGPNDYFHWEALANRTFSLGLLRAIREHADEMTPLVEDRKDRDRMGYQALELLADLVDEDPCSFDHHGGCQAHGFLALESGEICPQEQAKILLTKMEPPDC